MVLKKSSALLVKALGTTPKETLSLISKVYDFWRMGTKGRLFEFCFYSTIL